MNDKMTDARAQIASAEAALRRARFKLAEAERELAQQKTYPDEPQSDYIAFNVRFSASGQSYRYAAVRVNSVWYTTAGDRFSSWEKLVDWIRENDVTLAERRYVHELTSGGNRAIGL